MIKPQDPLFRHFEKYIKLSDTLKSELAERITFKTFKKGELVHNADKVCTKSYFIQNGLLRTYFLKNGKEISEYCSKSNQDKKWKRNQNVKVNNNITLKHQQKTLFILYLV